MKFIAIFVLAASHTPLPPPIRCLRHSDSHQFSLLSTATSLPPGTTTPPSVPDQFTITFKPNSEWGKSNKTNSLDLSSPVAAVDGRSHFCYPFGTEADLTVLHRAKDALCNHVHLLRIPNGQFASIDWFLFGPGRYDQLYVTLEFGRNYDTGYSFLGERQVCVELANYPIQSCSFRNGWYAASRGDGH